MKRYILWILLMILGLTACSNTSTSSSTRSVAPAPKTVQDPSSQADSQTESLEPLPSATSVQSDVVVANEESANSLASTEVNCEGKRQEGTVNWFSNEKGQGYITSDGGNDVLVHFTGILGEGYRTLQEGQRVGYCLENGPMGPQAVNVQVIGEVTDSPGTTEVNCEGKRQEGTVNWFSNEKGQGYITSDEGNDVLVHFTGILGEGYRTLQEGQRVEYCLEDGPMGPQAVNVQVIGP